MLHLLLLLLLPLLQLDGELVVLDGVAYQQGAEGTCRRVHPSEKVRGVSAAVRPAACLPAKQ